MVIMELMVENLTSNKNGCNSDLNDSAPLPDQISTIEPIEVPEQAKIAQVQSDNGLKD